MPIKKVALPTQLEEFAWIASEIRRLLDTGEETNEIAVIARKHDTLKQLLPILQYHNIHVFYELGQNVLQQRKIQELLTMVRFTGSLVQIYHPESDHLLVDILSYPFWGLEPVTLWQISLQANKRNQAWLEVMLEPDKLSLDPEQAKLLKQIAGFFIDLGTKARTDAAEKVLDCLMGVNTAYQPETSDEETDQSLHDVDNNKENFTSPFKRFYFDQPLQANLIENQTNPNNYNYLSFLSNLRVLIEAVRAHKRQEEFTLLDLVAFLDLLEKNGIPLIDNSPYDKNDRCVNLLSAHKAKGLEFKHVFVVSCQQSEWVGKNKGEKLGFPANLSLTPDKDILDDKLRLFFVAITRAREYLYLSGYRTAENGKESPPLGFLEDDWEDIKLDRSAKEEILQVYIDADGSKFLSWTDQQKSILEGALANYQLSVTHLNNFLDVTQGGPYYFLQTNLLRFPQMKSVNAGYGTAMHAAVRELYAEYKRKQNLPSLDYLLQQFEKQLKNERLTTEEWRLWHKQGVEKLTVYYQQKKNEFDPGSEIEFSFKSQGVQLGEARINGQIDKMDIDQDMGTIAVTDFKTGKSAQKWTGSDQHEKIKLWKYQQQLYFYKLLVENSRNFGTGFTVEKGALEFLEADKDGQIITLEADLDQIHASELSILIQRVYDKIMKLDFPDISKYDQTLDGIKQFAQDLVEGKV